MATKKKKSKAKAPSLRDQVLEQLRSAPKALSSQEITDILGLRRGARVRAHLRKLAEAGIVRREGPQNKAEWRLVDSDAASDADGAEATPVDTALTERLVEAMAAETKPWKARDLAKQLEADHLDIRAELVELEELGVVFRTGRTRGTRWHLG